MEKKERNEKNNLQKIRTEKKISVADLALMTGVSNERIYQIERGQSQPSNQLLMRLSRVLDVTPNDILMTDEGNDPVTVFCPYCQEAVLIKTNATGHIITVCRKCKKLLAVNLDTGTASVKSGAGL